MSIEHGFQTSLTVSFVLLAVVASAQSRIIHVDDDATGANDGTSWDNAYVHLQDALADANVSPKPVEIHVAHGIYRPDRNSIFLNRTGDRQATFALVDGTTLLGGYAGNDAVDPNVRDIETYRTILTGDLADNDAPVADPWGSLEDDPTRTDNSFRVVTVSGTDPNTVMTGFVITGAYEYAAGAPLERPENAGGLWVERGTRITVQGCIFSENVAPGMHCSEGSEVTVADCVFADNVTTGPGGGMLTYGRNVDIVRCTFERNRAWSGGGGLYHYDYYGYLRLEDCAFRYNATWWGGRHIPVGGIFGDVGGALCSGNATELIGCEFRGNSAGSGGAVRPGGNSTFTDCTFYGNRASVGGGAMILQGRISNVTGCIFSGNIAAAGGAVCQELGEACFTACLFSGNSGTDRGGGAVRIDDSLPRGALSMSIRPASTTRMPIRPTSAEFSNCTFVGNIAPEGRAIWFKTATSAKTEAGAVVLSNCITDNDGDEIHGQDAQATIAYTNLRGGLDVVYDPHDGISWGPGNIDADPLFAATGHWDPNGTPDDPKDDFWIDGDYHLKSEAGRWDPSGETWIRDDVTSPCIDAGDPNSPVAFELFPNGAIINMGTYGGTAEASKSSSGPHAQYGGGIGEPNDPYLIYTAEHLNTLGAEPNDYDKHFKLMADIDLSGYEYERAVIAPDVASDESGFQGVSFTGSFDGSDHMISNLHIEGGSYLGLFGQLGPEAIVFNLDLEAVDVYGMGDYIGGLVGRTLGSITSSNNAVADGGFVSGRDSVGGLAGSNSGSITQCHSRAAVSARYDVGGLVGFNSGDVTYCSNTGEVSGDSSVGGLVGHSFRGSRLNGCSNEGAVLGRVSIGGLVGRNFETSDVRNCYSHGNVSGIRYVGGLIGMNTFIAYAVNCYSTGAVNGDEEVGGLVGWSRDPSDVLHCFWDTQTSGQSRSSGGTGKTTTEMQTVATFLDAGWDFVNETDNGTDDVWWISEDQDYPRLGWEFSLVDKIVLEAAYILSCQSMDSRSDTYSAINNVYPGDGFTWIVPRENAMAILGLLLTTTHAGDQRYQQRAELAMDYLVSVQDQSDGAWAD